MPVADAEEVGDDAVACAGFDVDVHCGWADAEVGGGVGVVGPEVGEDAAFVFGGGGGEAGGGDELDGACVGGGGEDAVGG